jgi:hypothetical protein
MYTCTIHKSFQLKTIITVKSFATRVFQTTDPEDLSNITQETRNLGMIIVRGTQVSLVSPDDDMEEIENPFISADTEE